MLSESSFKHYGGFKTLYTKKKSKKDIRNVGGGSLGDIDRCNCQPKIFKVFKTKPPRLST